MRKAARLRRRWSKERLLQTLKECPLYSFEDLRIESGWTIKELERVLGRKRHFKRNRAEEAAQCYIDHIENDWPTLGLQDCAERFGIGRNILLEELQKTKKYRELEKLKIVGASSGSGSGHLKNWQKLKGYDGQKNWRGVGGVHSGTWKQQAKNRRFYPGMV